MLKNYKLWAVAGAISLSVSVASFGPYLFPNNAVMAKIGAVTNMLRTPKLPISTLNIEQVIDVKNKTGKEFILHTYLMGGEIKIVDYDRAVAPDCSVKSPQDKIKSLTLNLTPSHELTKWVLFSGKLKEGEKPPVKPQNIGTITVESSLLTSEAGPIAINKIREQLYSNNEKLVRCYERLALESHNAPLM